MTLAPLALSRVANVEQFLWCDRVIVSLTVSLDSPAQPVPLGTGAPIALTRVTVTTEPSAAPTTGSAGAAQAGRDSTAPSVSLSAPPSGHTVPSTVCNRELQPPQKTGDIFRERYVIIIYFMRTYL